MASLITQIATPLAVSTLVCGTCHAYDTKIVCTLDLRESSRSETAREKIVETFEILSHDQAFFIQPHSNRFLGINSRAKNTTSFNNTSTTNKWEVNQIYGFGDNNRQREMNVAYTIDRQTGRLTYKYLYDGGMVTIDASGPCEKISPQQQRKF